MLPWCHILHQSVWHAHFISVLQCGIANYHSNDFIQIIPWAKARYFNKLYSITLLLAKLNSLTQDVTNCSYVGM